jgi:hypothetical protein
LTLLWTSTVQSKALDSAVEQLPQDVPEDAAVAVVLDFHGGV